MPGSLSVYAGGMFAGKSTELQRQGKRQELAGRRVVFLKPKIDNRDGSGRSSTHDGDTVAAIEITFDGFTVQTQNTLQIQEVIDADVICIDEVQFFPVPFIRQIEKLIAIGKIVHVAGLDMDKNGLPFELMKNLMGIAENVQKFQAVCYSCGGNAWVSLETTKRESRINVGNEYKPACRACAVKHWRETK